MIKRVFDGIMGINPDEKAFTEELEECLRADAQEATRRMSEVAKTEGIQEWLDHYSNTIARCMDTAIGQVGGELRLADMSQEASRALFVLCLVQQVKEHANRFSPAYREAIEELCIESLMPTKRKDVCYRAPIEYTYQDEGDE